MKPLYKKKKFYIPVSILALLIVIRIILPSILLHEANKYLSEFSPTYYLHMEDLDISILRGAYRFEDVVGKLKGDNKQFLSISSVDVSIAWRHVFRGRIVTDIVTDNLDFLFLKDMSKLNPPSKKEAKDVKDTLFPVKVESVDLRRAQIVFEEYPSLDDKSRLKIENINGKVTNLTPSEGNPLSNFNLSASLQGQSPTVFVGELNLMKKPMLWDVDVELKDFNMTSLNPVLKRKLPLTFTKGTLDLFVEAQNDDKTIKGYIKPFLKDVDVIANKEQFVGVKHFVIEILTALGNLILRDSKTKSVATYFDFTYDGAFHANTGQGISKAIEHGFDRKLKEGIEDKYHMKE
jgi:hypothetical protein